MLDYRRHAPVGRVRPLRSASRTQGLSHVYRGRATRRERGVFEQDHGDARSSGRFRWLLSTCLAGAVGAVAISVVLFGSLDRLETSEAVLPTLEKLRETRFEPVKAAPQPIDGLNWTVPKSDRLLASASSARQIIHDQVQIRRDNRPFIEKRQYLRVLARLSDASTSSAKLVPPFNPLQLYAASPSTDDDDGTAGAHQGEVAVQVLELFGGILPSEDGQELDVQEVVDIVNRAAEAEVADLRPGVQEGSDAPEATADAARDDASLSALAAPNTTVLAKSVAEFDETDDALEKSELRSVRAVRGDTLVRILQRFGAENWQARTMVEAARSIFPETQLSPGQEIQVTLVPSLARPDKLEPARFTVQSETQEHKVTVYRNAAGEFVASATPQEGRIARASLGDNDQVQSASLYASLYQSALLQGLQPDTIMQILRVHAYETDFRRRVRHGDMIDFFFDLKGEGAEATPGELLYTSISASGELQRFWRFRTSDGVVDYYDEAGDNSKKFLMRRPVRGESVRLSSGFGVRFHPIVNVTKMHTGVDWAAPIGTPILAAGTGVIEEAGRHGQNGNYVRIRHANGYHTTYSHMLRFGQNIAEGVKVRQGQVIGYIGMTGLTNGPHLHFEVLVNTRFVDPLSIQVPRERRLTGRQLADFQKERARIDELMRRAPAVVAAAKS